MDIIGGTLSNTLKIKIKVFTPRRAGGINLQEANNMRKQNESIGETIAMLTLFFIIAVLGSLALVRALFIVM